MKRKTKRNSKNNFQERVIEKALRIGGFIFPTFIDEVKEFERIYGKTEIILPPELQESTVLESNTSVRNKTKKAKLILENFAMAAREGTPKIPTEIKLKIISDIKNEETKRKRKKNK
jgi:hypothetical protein